MNLFLKVEKYADVTRPLAFLVTDLHPVPNEQTCVNSIGIPGAFHDIR